jgi:hypothetical protein
MDADGVERRTYDQVRLDAVDRYIWIGDNPTPELLALRRSPSIYRRLAEDITFEAAKYAVQNNISVEDFRYGACREALEALDNLAGAFQQPSFNHDEVDELEQVRSKLNFWQHKDNALRLVKDKKVPYFGRAELEAAASQYLELPFRAQSFDRILVDALVALELFQFSDEMVNAVDIPFIGTRSPLKQRHVLRTWFSGILVNSFLCGGAVGIAAALNHWDVISDDPVIWTAGIALLIWVVLFTIATIALPFAWRTQSKARQNTFDLMASMDKTYFELRSGEVISANHILDCVKAAASLGVIWPSPLYALLDDVIRRTGRF